jgi:glycine dehydrogenase subunit 2
MTEPIIYELSAEGRCAVTLPALDVPPAPLPEASLLRDDLDLPEVAELDLVRHYMHLSQMNYGVDTGLYPLGSCTMKYNPKVNEDAARLPGFTGTHPYQPACTVQGNLRLMFELQEYLRALSGFSGVSLQPAAGAHGELTGILMIRAYLRAHGQHQRDVILIPDSAHGTNPASTAMAGFRVVELKSDARGNVSPEQLTPHLNERLAGIMLTNPNTLGLFEEHILEITQRVHAAGGLVYGDGANFNALMGVVRPADLGIDVMHFNLHKTFSTPHGGGGPGAGPVGANKTLAPYLPGPIATAQEQVVDLVTNEFREDMDPRRIRDDDERYTTALWFDLGLPEHSIGRVKAFHGQFGVLVRAYTYIRTLGAQGLFEASQTAVLNANYLQAILKNVFPLKVERVCMHEFVLQGQLQGAPDIHALDIAKRLIDYGIHPPTNYFPLIVPEALMIEPTETESKRTLDAFADAMTRIAQEAREQPELLHAAPTTAPVRRLDEVLAARQLVLRYQR